jgi:hypothetical protein
MNKKNTENLRQALVNQESFESLRKTIEDKRTLETLMDTYFFDLGGGNLNESEKVELLKSLTPDTWVFVKTTKRPRGLVVTNGQDKVHIFFKGDGDHNYVKAKVAK